MERYARQMQDGGAPVVITYPGMVLGPPAGDQFGEAAEGVESLLKAGLVPGDGAAGWTIVDVRDVAALHAALTEPGRGPRRYMCGGRLIAPADLARLLTTLTGRRFPVAPVPGPVLRGLGRLVDQFSRVVPLRVPLTAAAMEYYTHMPATNDEPSRVELGISNREVHETLADTISGLRRCGRVNSRQIGVLGRQG